MCLNDKYINNETLICPYCGREQDGHEPDEISAYLCITECEYCGRTFEYSVIVTRTYDSGPYAEHNDESFNDDAECDEENSADDDYYY